MYDQGQLLPAAKGPHLGGFGVVLKPHKIVVFDTGKNEEVSPPEE